MLSSTYALDLCREDRKESNVPKLRRSYYPNIYTVIVDLTMYFPRSKLKKEKKRKKDAAAPPLTF